jgi:hypothetical protein
MWINYMLNLLNIQTMLMAILQYVNYVAMNIVKTQKLIDNGSKKICSKCKIEKLCFEFYRQFGKFGSFCKACHNSINKNNYWKKTNEEINMKKDEYRDKNEYKFVCNNCNYNTNDKYNYWRHYLSQKHIDKIKTTEILEGGQ